MQSCVISATWTNQIPVNGRNGAKAEAPAASQATPGEAEDDSDDDQEDGEGAPETRAAGGE